MSDQETLSPAHFTAAVDDARLGGEHGLTTLFRAFHPQLLRYLRARESRHAEDIAAETWLAVAGRIHDFDGGGAAFAAWLFTIARQRLADLRRTGARRKTDPVAEIADDRLGRTAEDAAFETLDGQAAVDLIVGSLTPDQADVVLMRALGGVSVADVATMLGRTEVWVRVTHHRAIRRLQDRMTELHL